MIQSWYGGPAMPGPFSDTYVPAGWNSSTAIAGTTFAPIDLYKNVVAPYCRTCHILRGTKNQDDINFFTYGTPAAGVTPATGFQSLADRIKVHVFDRGNMPLAQIPHSDFWGSSAPQMLASFVDAMLGAGTATSNGAPLMPGRPIADPGPDRMVRTGANAVLTGENSLFASTFSWTHVSGPSNPVITNANAMVAIFNASVAGTYVENLSVNGGASSKNVTITVDDNFPDPLNIKFAQVKNVLQNVAHKGTTKCVDCHKNVATPLPVTTPPIWYTSFDRDNDGAVNSTDEAWFLKAISGRVNLTEIVASPLLRKPTGNHHNAGKVIDVADGTTNGGLWNYSVLYNWILAGMQPGGVAANPLVNGGAALPALTFTGSPLFSSNIALDGSTSIGATNFLWTVAGPSGPTGAFPFISNPTSPSPVLNVPNVGTYVVQLHVDDGTSSDAVQRIITVSEPAINANFNPQTGSVLPTSLALGRGNVTLTSTSTYTGSAGAPVTCRWQILSGPAGALLDGSAVLDVTKDCGTPAVLNVATSPAGGIYNVQLTASTLGTGAPVTHALTVSSTAPTASLANMTTPQNLTFSSNGTNTTIQTNTSLTGGGTVGSFAFPNVQATASLDGTASTTPTGTLTYAWCVSSQPDVTRFPASLPVCPATTAPSLSSTTSMIVKASGSYGIQLTVNNGSSSASASRTLTVGVTGGTTFQTIVNTVNDGINFPCAGCHVYSSPSVVNTATQIGSAPPWDNATLSDGTTLYQRIRQRTNIGSAASSLLLVCPHSGCGGMGAQTAFSSTLAGSIYDQFLQWISHGAPPGN